MSGGSMGYLYCQVQECAVGMMEDTELDDLMQDLADLLHDAEWYHSGDIGEKRYRAAVNVFKRKWFQDSREDRLLGYIDKELKSTREKLYELLGVNVNTLTLTIQDGKLVQKENGDWYVPKGEQIPTTLYARIGGVTYKGGLDWGGRHPGEQGVQGPGKGADEAAQGEAGP